MRKLSLGLVVVTGLFALAAAGPAGAQVVWTNDCPDMPPDLVSATDDAIETREQGQRDVTICLANTERLEALYALQLDAIESETTASAQRVALAPVDRNRLDLTWMGTWATVGVLFGLLVAPMMQRAFRWWH